MCDGLILLTGIAHRLTTVTEYVRRLRLWVHQPPGSALSISSVDVVMPSDVTRWWIRFFFSWALLMNVLSSRTPFSHRCYFEHPPGPYLHNLHGTSAYLSLHDFFGCSVSRSERILGGAILSYATGLWSSWLQTRSLSQMEARKCSVLCFYIMVELRCHPAYQTMDWTDNGVIAAPHRSISEAKGCSDPLAWLTGAVGPSWTPSCLWSSVPVSEFTRRGTNPGRTWKRWWSLELWQLLKSRNPWGSDKTMAFGRGRTATGPGPPKWSPTASSRKGSNVGHS